MVRKTTERQLEYLRAIAELTERLGYSPTVREIGEAVGVKSPSTTQNTLEALRRKGLVEWAPDSPRTIRLTWAGRRAVQGQGGKGAARPCECWTDDDLYIIWAAMYAMVHDVQVHLEGLTKEQWQRAVQLFRELDMFFNERWG